MAAAEAGRDVCYFTFDDVHLVQTLHEVYTVLRDNATPVGMCTVQLISRPALLHFNRAEFI